MKKLAFFALVVGLVFFGCDTGNGTNEFVASTNETISNDVATLGLIGTSVASSNPSVATAEITASAKIKITSVSEGSAVITVSDALSHSATINISVAKTGSITIGAVVKYVAGTTGGNDNGTDNNNGNDNGTTGGNSNGTDNNSGNDNGTTGGNNNGNDNGTTGGNNNGNGNGDEFVASTNETISNDAATLGLTGTSVASSNSGVATAEITTSAKIKITSVSEGSAVITVSDASSHSATINISVAKTGSITIGAVVKYTAGNGENAQLPEPVGTNELNGKTYDNGFYIISFVADNTYTLDARWEELERYETGFYSWNMSQKTVLLTPDKIDRGFGLQNRSELRASLIEYYSDEGSGDLQLSPGTTLEQYIDMWIERDFALVAYTYEIEDSEITCFSIKITLPDNGTTIAGCAYTQKIVTELFDVHYLLSTTFDDALTTLTTAYGQPEPRDRAWEWYRKCDSILTESADYVILEFTTYNDMRLTKRESGGEPTTKGWILP